MTAQEIPTIAVGAVPWLSMKIVAGAANNQLATDPDGERLGQSGILYAPDFVINAGGAISASAEREDGAGAKEVDARIKAVGERTAEIFARAKALSMISGPYIFRCSLIKHIVMRGVCYDSTNYPRRTQAAHYAVGDN